MLLLLEKILLSSSKSNQNLIDGLSKLLCIGKVRKVDVHGVNPALVNIHIADVSL